MPGRTPPLPRLAPAVVLALVLAACASEEPAPADPGGVVDEVGMVEFGYEPSGATVAAGSTLTVVNDGTVVHDLNFRGEDGQRLVGSPIVDPGDQADFVVDVAPGSYEVYCSVPGHEAAGMVDTYTVADAAG